MSERERERERERGRELQYTTLMFYFPRHTDLPQAFLHVPFTVMLHMFTSLMYLGVFFCCFVFCLFFWSLFRVVGKCLFEHLDQCSSIEDTNNLPWACLLLARLSASGLCCLCGENEDHVSERDTQRY